MLDSRRLHGGFDSAHLNAGLKPSQFLPEGDHLPHEDQRGIFHLMTASELRHPVQGARHRSLSTGSSPVNESDWRLRSAAKGQEFFPNPRVDFYATGNG